MTTKIKSSNIENQAIAADHLHDAAITGHTEITAINNANDYLVVYNAAAGGLRKITAGNLQDFSAIDQHMIPNGNEVYDLGEPTNKWRDLYLSAGTIYMADTRMSVDPTTGDLEIKDADTGAPKRIKVKEIEIDDPDADNNFKTVMKKVNGNMKFVKVDRSTGIESTETETQEFDQIKIGDSIITADDSGKLVIPRDTVLGDSSKTSQIPEVNLTIAPEILEIQVSSPFAGQSNPWLWTWEQSTLPYARRKITNSPEITVPLYKQGKYVINNFARTSTGVMTQGHGLFLKWIDGAGLENLVSWSTDQGTLTYDHPDINDGNPVTVQRLSVEVPSDIVLPTLVAPTTVEYDITFTTAGAYTFESAASGNNPNIGPIYRGGTYTFNVNAAGHPFYITTDNGTNFVAGAYFGEYTTGVTGSRTDVGTITFTVPDDAPDTLYYQCGQHSSMRGAITVKDLKVETNINGNYVIYAQHGQEGMKTPVEIRPIPSLVNQMCLVYDASVGQFVPQDLATYVENTPSFENKIREVAGTAELVVEDGSAVIAKVNVYDDSTYLPLTGNNPGDQAFATDTDILYIWDGSAWQQAGAANTDDLEEGTTNLFYTDERVDARIGLVVDGAPGALNTLNELAAALGDDANFASTVTNNLATKVDKINITGSTVGSSTAIPVITYNEQGQITSATTTSITVGNGTLTVSGSNGLTGSGTFTANQASSGSITITHADTSSQSNVSNSGNTFIQSLEFDGFGHVTGATSGSVSVGNGTLTVNSGAGLTGSGTFSANQSSNNTITLSHADTSSQGSVNNSGTTVIQDITLDGYGHITAIGSVELNTQFLGINAKATDADKLDGYDWMQSGKNIRGTNIYADDWFRNYNSGEGLYNEATGAHWVSDADGSWTARDSASHMRIRMKTNGTTERGSFYANSSNEVGILDAGGSWAIKHTNDNGTRFYTDGTTEEFRVGRDTVSGNYGTVQTVTSRSGWGGYSIAGKYVFMSDHGVNVGIYNDENNEWMTRWYQNGKTELHYNGSPKFETTNTGVNVSGELTINGTPLSTSSSGFTGLRVTSSGRLESYQAADGESVTASDFGQWFTQAVDFQISADGHLIINL